MLRVDCHWDLFWRYRCAFHWKKPSRLSLPLLSFWFSIAQCDLNLLQGHYSLWFERSITIANCRVLLRSYDYFVSLGFAILFYLFSDSNIRVTKAYERCSSSLDLIWKRAWNLWTSKSKRDDHHSLRYYRHSYLSLNLIQLRLCIIYTCILNPTNIDRNVRTKFVDWTNTWDSTNRVGHFSNKALCLCIRDVTLL